MGVQAPKEAKSIGQWIRKALLASLAAICLVLGMIGLILPIIPGILFLFLGAWLLAKLSSRFASHFNQNHWARKWLSRGTVFKPLSPSQRIKLSFLYATKALVDSADSLWSRMTKTAKPAQKSANAR